MPTPPLPPEAMYWTAFNESESLAIIMRAQNYINQELIRTHSKLWFYVGLRESFVDNEIFAVQVSNKQKLAQRQEKK